MMFLSPRRIPYYAFNTYAETLAVEMYDRLIKRYLALMKKDTLHQCSTLTNGHKLYNGPVNLSKIGSIWEGLLC